MDRKYKDLMFYFSFSFIFCFNARLKGLVISCYEVFLIICP